MNDLEAFRYDIQENRELYIGKHLDGTRGVVRTDDYVLLMIQHTDGSKLYMHKDTFSDPIMLTKSLNAYLRKYHDNT